MLMCERWLPLEYQAVIFAGDESDGPSNREIAPMTTRTAEGDAAETRPRTQTRCHRPSLEKARGPRAGEYGQR